MATDALLASLPRRIGAIPRRWGASAPQAHALHDGQRHWTYGELAAAVDSTIALLRSLDVRPGDRLMLVGENCPAQVVLSFAAADADAWIVHVNARLSAREVDQIASHSGARRIIYTSADSPDAAAHGIRRGAQPASWHGGDWLVEALNEDCEPATVYTDGARQVAALVYTTGTTGQPKGVMLSHRNLMFIAIVSSTLRGLVPSDRAYGVLPISHVYGLASVMLGTLYSGACLYLAARFVPDTLLYSLRKQGLTIVQGVPAMYARLLEQVGDGATLPNSLRFAYAGGSPLTPNLKTRVETLLGLPLHNGYGLTETSPTISQTRLDVPRKDTSVGPVIPGVQARLVDAGGQDVAEGDIGELWVRGPNVMLGYYRAPELTEAVMRPGGWFNTGDMAHRDAGGALFIDGRSKELIIRSGFNVYPLEVETVLNAHPAVTQSAVVGRSVEDGNEEVVAFVEIDPRHTITPEALNAWLAEGLSAYKCPSQIVVMDLLPAAATGKILKGQLREMAQRLRTAI